MAEQQKNGWYWVDVIVRAGFLALAGLLVTQVERINDLRGDIRVLQVTAQAGTPRYIEDAIKRTDVGIKGLVKKVDDLIVRVGKIELRVGMSAWEGK